MEAPNISEYVGDILAGWDDTHEGKPAARDLAEQIADVSMAQGYYEGMEFTDVVGLILPQVEYYL